MAEVILETKKTSGKEVYHYAHLKCAPILNRRYRGTVLASKFQMVIEKNPTFTIMTIIHFTDDILVSNDVSILAEFDFRFTQQAYISKIIF